MHSALQRLRAHSLAGHPLADLALAAGKDALHCAGIGWYPESDVTATLHAGQAIALQLVAFKRLELKVNPDLLAQRAAELQRAASTDNPLGIVWSAVRSLVRLFAGYYDTCPRDSWGHRRLIEAASWGAFGSYYPSESERQVSASIASFFERTLVAYALTRAEGAQFVSGLAMERMLNQHPPHLLSALFQRTQAILFPTECKNAARIYPLEPEPTADALLLDVLFTLFRARLRSARGHLRLRGKIRCPVSWEWEDTVERLAELLAPYLMPQPDSGPTPPNPFQQPGLLVDRPPSLGLPTGGWPMVDPGDLVNPFADSGAQDRQGTPPPPGRGGSRPGTEQGPGLAYDFERLDDYYSRQARSLRVKDGNDDRHEEEPEMLPVGFLDCAPARLQDLACGQIDWFRTRWSPPSPANPSGLKLCRLTDPLEIPANTFDPASRDAPNLLLVVDSSGSMKFDPRSIGPGRGKYDVVLMACWGLFRYLGERGLGDRVWINAVNFSGATRSSGWHRGDALDPVKRVLAAYQGGGTRLGTTAIQSARESAPGRFLTITMTDGSLGNTEQALEELHRTVQSGNSLALLHIGAPNAFTEGVRDMGGAVHILNQADDLVGLCLDLAKANYGAERRD